MASSSHPGVYKAIVISNTSSTLGVQVPQLFGTAVITAAPLTTPGTSVVPAIGSQVWVAFQNGEGRFPVWLGAVSPGQASQTMIGAPGQTTLTVQAGVPDTTLHPIQLWNDYLTNPIMWLANAGGLHLTDNLRLDQSVFGPTNFSADIYGYVVERGAATFHHAGAPGNTFDMATATGETFQGNRGPSIGNWNSNFGATGITAVANPFTTNPGETFNIIQLTQGIGTNMVALTATTLAQSTPCVAGNYVKAVCSMRAATTTRAVTPYILWMDSGGGTTLGSVTGTPVSVTAGAWVTLSVGGTAPVGTNGAFLQLGASSMGAAEIDYVTAAGIWVDTRTVSAADPNPENIWSPSFTGQNDGVNGWLYVKPGDTYIRTDAVATSGKRIYMFDGTFGTYYLPRQVGAPGSTSAPRWVSVA